MKEQFFDPDPFDEDLGDWLGQHFDGEVFRPGFERTREIFSSVVSRLKEMSVPTVIIGGTNGKGEVALLLEHLACEEGYHPYVWMSPHIVSVRERFCCEGKPIEGKRLLAYFERFKGLVGSVSYYEFLFYCFCHYVEEDLLTKQNSVKKPVLILEVGLGGRLDATNLFDGDVACLTSIGRDHMPMLGHTLSQVLSEKIMISRGGKPLVTGVQQSYLRDQITRFCQEHSIIHYDLYSEDKTSIEKSFRALNGQLAIKVWTLLIHSSDHKKKSSNDLRIPDNLSLWGRPLLVTYVKSTFILLGTHNLDGLRSLLTCIADKESFFQNLQFPADEVWVALTRENEQEVQDFLELVLSAPCLAKKVVVTTFGHPRATSLKAIEKAMSGLNVSSDRVTLEEDWKSRVDNTTLPTITILGSYYFIGEAYRYLCTTGPGDQ